MWLDLRLQGLQACLGDLPVDIADVGFFFLLFGKGGGATRPVDEVFRDQHHDEDRDKGQHHGRPHADAVNIAGDFGTDVIAQFGR